MEGMRRNRPAYVPNEVIYPRGRKPLFEYLRDNAREFPDRTVFLEEEQNKRKDS